MSVSGGTTFFSLDFLRGSQRVRERKHDKRRRTCANIMIKVHLSEVQHVFTVGTGSDLSSNGHARLIRGSFQDEISEDPCVH